MNLPGQQRHLLTDEQMQRILTIANTGNASAYFGDFVTAVWKAILGDDCFADGKPQINPMLHAIPQAQWQELCKRLVAGANEHSRVPVAMDWVNIGPSAYVEDSRE